MERDELMKVIERTFPQTNITNSESFNGLERGIRMCEGSLIDELFAFDYYSDSDLYTMNIHKKLFNFLEEREWFAEFHDPGTLMIWPV